MAEQYITKFGELANASDTTMIVPASVADVSSMMATAMSVISRTGNGGAARPAPATPTPRSPSDPASAESPQRNS